MWSGDGGGCEWLTACDRLPASSRLLRRHMCISNLWRHVVVSYLIGLYTWVYGRTQIALYLLVRGKHVVDPKRCV
jgi:hypothetical protein